MSDDKPRTLFGMPVVEVDMPEMEDKVILFGDFSNWAAAVNIRPSRKAWWPDILLASIVAITAAQLYRVWLAVGDGYLLSVALSTEERPYVYRALLPMLSRGLSWLTGFDVVACLVALVILSAIGLYFAMRYLLTAFQADDTRASVAAFVVTEALFLLLLSFPHVYDVPTAFFVALMLGLLARGKHTEYLLLFPLATLNRETAILLTVFYAVWFLGKTEMFIYMTAIISQLFAYGGITSLIRQAYAANPGAPFHWQPAYNLQMLAGSPLTTALLLCFFTTVLFVTLRGWQGKPLFLRTAFVVIFPLQVALWLTMGGVMELRVFAESLPIVGALAFYRKDNEWK